MRSALLLSALLLVLTGCAGGGDGADPSAETPSSPSVSPSQDPSGSPSSEPLEPPAVPADDPLPCAKVRAGIDAFNEGAPRLTVRFFTQAVPEAEQYAEDQPGRTADLLLAAVRYYAELPPEDYAAAITGSAEFKRHQIVTLAVCRYDGDGGGEPGEVPTDDAVPA